MALLGIVTGVLVIALYGAYNKISSLTNAVYKITRDADRNFNTIKRGYSDMQQRLEEVEDKLAR